MNDRKLEILSKTMGAALVGNSFKPIPLKISFHIKKRVTCTSLVAA